MKHSLQKIFQKIEVSLGSVCISLIVFVGLLYAVEHTLGGLITEESERRFTKSAYFEPKPFLMFGGTSNPELQQREGLNSLGHRGPVPPLTKDPNEYRVFIIGGSTVLQGSPPLPELVQGHFKEAGRSEVRVYNFGTTASNLRMDIARVVFEVSAAAPDLIVFYGGGNDIGLPFQGDPRPGYPFNFLAYEHNPLLTAGTEAQSWGTLLKLALFQSKLMRFYAGPSLRDSLVPLERVRREVGWNTPEWSTSVAQKYLADISLANRVVKGLGAKALFVFQPILPFKRNRSRNERELLPDDLIKHSLICRTTILAGLKDLPPTEHINISDASGVFDDIEDDVFVDGIHLRQNYQPVVSKFVFESALGVMP